jgi:hypothetical protein
MNLVLGDQHVRVRPALWFVKYMSREGNNARSCSLTHDLELFSLPLSLAAG